MLGGKIGVTQRTLTFAFSPPDRCWASEKPVSGVIVGLGYLLSYLFVGEGGVGVEEKESWLCVICFLLFSTPSLSHPYLF